MLYRLYDLLYTSPLVRVIPYQAGLLMGYFAHWLRKYPRKVEKVAWLAYYLALAYVLSPIVFATDVDHLSSLICSLGYSIGKFVYGASIGGIIIMCIMAPESLIPKTLCRSAFVHLNKLCYGMFLVHPAVVILLFGLRTQPVFLTPSLLVRFYYSMTFKLPIIIFLTVSRSLTHLPLS